MITSCLVSVVQSLRKGGLLSHSSLQSNFVSDAIIGSLPRGLSGKEREKVFQSVPLSPTLNLLNSMPQVHPPFCTWCPLQVDTRLWQARLYLRVGYTGFHLCRESSHCLQEKVSSRSFDGRRLRRHVLRGAVIVFITAGYSGKKFIFEKVIAC